MKRFYSFLIGLLFLTGLALTTQAQAGRVRGVTRSPADTGPFSEPLNKAPEQPITQQGHEPIPPGNVQAKWPEFVDGERIYRPSEVDTKAVVLKKPKAAFTREARKRAIEGTVVLRVIFSATGEVKNPTLLFGLPYGLTESAIKASQKLKFRPAIKDGKPVPMWVHLEYIFSLY